MLKFLASPRLNLIDVLGIGLFYEFGAEGEWLFAFISLFSTLTLSVMLERKVYGSTSSRNGR